MQKKLLTPLALFSVALVTPTQAALVYHWEFDEPGMPTSSPGNGSYYTTESINNDNNGRFWGANIRAYNNLSVSPSPVGGGKAWFDATGSGNDPHVLPNTPSIPAGDSSRTIAAWINADATQPNNSFIFSYGTNANGQRFSFRLSNGKLRLEIQGGGIEAGADLRDNTWHHVAVVVDGSGATTTLDNATLYVDGVALTTSGSATIDTVLGGFSTTIGNSAHNNATSGFNGAVDDVRVYDNPLTGDEIRALALVPEPSSTALLGLGGLALILRRRKWTPFFVRIYLLTTRSLTPNHE